MYIAGAVQFRLSYPLFLELLSHQAVPVFMSNSSVASTCTFMSCLISWCQGQKKRPRVEHISPPPSDPLLLYTVLNVVQVLVQIQPFTSFQTTSPFTDIVFIDIINLKSGYMIQQQKIRRLLSLAKQIMINNHLLSGVLIWRTKSALHDHYTSLFYLKTN